MVQIYRYIDVMITHYKMAGDHNVHVSIDLGHTALSHERHLLSQLSKFVSILFTNILLVKKQKIKFEH